jgi:hypothetical protein
LLEFKGFTPASLAAGAFIVVVVDEQLELLQYEWEETVSDNTSLVRITVPRNGKVRAFVSWNRTALANKAVRQALNELRQSPQRDTLALPGALAQRSLTIDLQAEHDR